MKIKDMFKKKIDRSIESVIKVLDLDDEEKRKVELEEYVITEEVGRNIRNFFTAFLKSLEEPVEEVGVWISGFFGSGKSHFLKILYYLLENVKAGDKTALEYFREKLDDELLIADIEKAAKCPKKVILFEIGSRADRRTRETVTQTLESVFYSHHGLHVENEKVFQMEKFLFKEGKFEEFKSEFRKRTGKDWDNEYKYFLKYETTLKEIISDIFSFPKDFNIDDLKTRLTVESFTEEILEYAKQKGEDYKIIFLIDEMGQYIADNPERMQELQSIVENFGRIGKGKLWIVVTAQEDIESIFKRVRSFDFSKIMDRFRTRLKLSSYSVDEVVKKRILEKNDVAREALSTLYENVRYSLENAISFLEASHEFSGYSNADEFVDVYPFVPYQIKLLQKVFEKKREQGIAGQYTPSGERSLLYSFQKVLIRFADKDLEEGILVPFNSFYDPLEQDFSTSVIRVIEGAKKNPVLTDFDVEVLKLLFLLKDIDEMPANIDNITTLMMDSVEADKMKLREEIINALDRLQEENLIDKGPKGFVFLTTEEQKISAEIRNTPVDPKEITKKIYDLFSKDIYDETSVKFNKFITLPFSVMVNGENFSRQKREMTLHIVTHDYKEFDIALIQSDSTLLIKLPENPELEETIETVVKIEKYLKSRDWSSQPEKIRAIIEIKRSDLNSLEAHAKRLLENSFENAKYFVNGNEISPVGSNAVEKIKNALIQLANAVYTKANLAKRSYNDDDLKKLLDKPDLYEQYNADAASEIIEFLSYENNPTVSDVASRFQKKPYGWPKNFTKAVILTLLLNGEIELLYGSELLRPSSEGFIDKIIKEREAEKIRIRRKEKVKREILDTVKSLIHELFQIIDLPDDQDRLAELLIRKSKEFLDNLEWKLRECERGSYRFCDSLRKGIELLNSIPFDGPSHVVLRRASEISNELIEWKRSSQNVLNFLEEGSNQRKIFDSGRDVIRKVDDVKRFERFVSLEEIKDDIEALRRILESENPFSEIPKIPELRERIDKFLKKVLEREKEKVKDKYLKKLENVVRDKEKLEKEILTAIERAGDIITLFAIDGKFNEMIEEASKYTPSYVNDDNSRITFREKPIKTLKLSSIVGRRVISSKKDIDELVNTIRRKLEDELNKGFEIEIEG